MSRTLSSTAIFAEIDQTANNTGCIYCGSFNAKLLFKGYDFDDSSKPFDVVECLECHLARTFPVPGPKALAQYYSQDYYGSSEAKFNGFLEWLVRLANTHRARTLTRFLPLDHVPASTKILDIGCGRGKFLRFLRRKNYSCVGIDIPEFSFPEDNEGIQFLNGDLEKIPFEISSFDAVSIWYVLEHVTNPLLTVQKISRILKPDGVVAIAVPNFSGFQPKIFGRHWFHLDLPRHLFHFPKEHLMKMLQENDLHPIEVSTSSAEQNCFGFIQSGLNFIFYKRRANELFSFLKSRPDGRKGSSRLFFLGLNLVISCLLFPFGVMEHFVSVLTGQGAMLIIYARKAKVV